MLLDLYCGAGGAAVGYHYAGFRVIGVDIDDQPAFPFTFIKADVLELDLPRLVAESGAVAIHSSPPCQRLSRLRFYQPKTIEDRYLDLIDETRELLEPLGLPYVVENVELARRRLRDPVMLCGTQFDDVEVLRHRLFELSGFALPALPHSYADHPLCARNGYLPTAAAPFMTISGGKHSAAWQRRACQAMGVPWVAVPANASVERTKIGIREVCEAIPPCYTTYVGAALMAEVMAGVPA